MNSDRNHFPVILQAQEQRTKDGQATISVMLTVPATGLNFTERNGWRLQELAFLTVLENGQGGFISAREEQDLGDDYGD